jgi:hypothetical protein
VDKGDSIQMQQPRVRFEVAQRDTFSLLAQYTGRNADSLMKTTALIVPVHNPALNFPFGVAVCSTA